MKETKPKKKRLSFEAVTQGVNFDFDSLQFGGKKSPKSPKSPNGSDDIFDGINSPSTVLLSPGANTLQTFNSFRKPNEDKKRAKSVFDYFGKKTNSDSSATLTPILKREESTIKKSASLQFDRPFRKEAEEFEIQNSEKFHSDYHHFKEVDLEDYSYVKEPISWVPKTFNSLEESMEDEFVNPLFEEFIHIQNPLADEFYEYKNPLADELVEYTSPIFDGSKNFLSELDEVELISKLQKLLLFEDRVTAQKNIGIKLKMKYQCFLGGNLVDEIQNLSELHFTRADSVSYCQYMMDGFVFKNVDCLEASTFSETDFYRFTDYWDFFSDRQMNSRVLTVDMQQYFVPFEHRIDSYVIVRTFDNLMNELYETNIKTNLYTKNFNKNIGYLVIWKSSAFEELKSLVYKLQKVNLLEFNENIRKSFLINLYNLMVLHALMICKKPENYQQRLQTFQKHYYIVGRHKFTIPSLEELLLSRENTDPIGFKFDPRVRFCLHKGNLGGPILRYYPWDHFYNEKKHYKLDYQIKFSTKFYMKKEVKINDETETILLPMIFKTHATDYGDTLEDQLLWISNFIEKKENQRQNFLEKMKKYKIEYIEEDTKFNRRTFKEEILEFILPFPEVRDNQRFRKYFIKFCEAELSVENIECYQEIIEFNKINNPNERYRKAVQIYDEFLAPGDAPKEININTKQIFRVRDEINIEKASLKKNENYKPNVVSTLFEEIKQSLNHVMIDTYSRFILSEGYYELVEQCLDEILDRKSIDENVDKKNILKKALGY